MKEQLDTITKKSHSEKQEITMKKIFIGFLILIAACSAAFAETLTEKDAGQTIHIKLNEPINIILKANITTGYKWHYTSEQSESYQVLNESYKVDKHPEGMVGVGGHSIYQINPTQKGTLTITARYFRPWEQFNPDKDKELKFNFEIEE